MSLPPELAGQGRLSEREPYGSRWAWAGAAVSEGLKPHYLGASCDPVSG